MGKMVTADASAAADLPPPMDTAVAITQAPSPPWHRQLHLAHEAKKKKPLCFAMVPTQAGHAQAEQTRAALPHKDRPFAFRT